MNTLEATYRLAALASSTSFAALVKLLLIESGHAGTAKVYASAVEDLRLAETAAHYASLLDEVRANTPGIDLSRAEASLPLLRSYADRRVGELPQEVEDRIREHDDG